MGEWSSADEDDNFQLQPLATKKCGVATSNKPAKRQRFAQPTISTELEKSSTGAIPKNTQKNDQWALRAFRDWIQEQNRWSEESVLKTS